MEVSAATARHAAELGFRGIKTKGKLEDPLEEGFRAMHEAVPGLRTVIDPKERFYTSEQFPGTGAAAGGPGHRVRGPVPKDRYEDYRRLREQTSILVTMHLQSPRQVIDAVYLRRTESGMSFRKQHW